MLVVKLECQPEKKIEKTTYESKEESDFRKNRVKCIFFNLTTNIERNLQQCIWLCHLHLSATSSIDSIEHIQYSSFPISVCVFFSLSSYSAFTLSCRVKKSASAHLNCVNTGTVISVALACEWIYSLLSENNKLMQSHSNLFVHMLRTFCLYMCNDIMSFSSIYSNDWMSVWTWYEMNFNNANTPMQCDVYMYQYRIVPVAFIALGYIVKWLKIEHKWNTRVLLSGFFVFHRYQQ